jgi:hypothetical protein
MCIRKYTVNAPAHAVLKFLSALYMSLIVDYTGPVWANCLGGGGYCMFFAFMAVFPLFSVLYCECVLMLYTFMYTFAQT